jgi:hypothetical protein
MFDVRPFIMPLRGYMKQSDAAHKTGHSDERGMRG